MKIIFKAESEEFHKAVKEALIAEVVNASREEIAQILAKVVDERVKALQNNPYRLESVITGSIRDAVYQRLRAPDFNDLIVRTVQGITEAKFTETGYLKGITDKVHAFYASHGEQYLRDLLRKIITKSEES